MSAPNEKQWTPSSTTALLEWSVVVVSALLWLAVAFVAFFSWDRSNADVHVYFQAGERLSSGGELFLAEPGKRFINPPFVGVVFAALNALPILHGYAVWMALHLVLIALIGALLADGLEMSWDRGRRFAAVSCLVLLAPVAAELSEGQMNLLVLAPVVAGVRWLLHGRDGRAGVAFALAAHLKAYPVLLILALVALGRRRAVYAMVIGLGVFVFAPALVLAPINGIGSGLADSLRLHAEFVETIAVPALGSHEVFGTPEFYSSNYSPLGVAQRLFGEGVALGPAFMGRPPRVGPLWLALPPALIGIVARAISLSVIVSGLWVCRKRGDRSLGLVSGVYLVLLGANILNLTFWEHHMVSLVVALALLCGTRNVSYRAVWLGRVGMAILLLTLSLPWLIAVAGEFAGMGSGSLIGLTRDYGTPLVGVLCLAAALTFEVSPAGEKSREERVPATRSIVRN